MKPTSKIQVFNIKTMTQAVVVFVSRIRAFFTSSEIKFSVARYHCLTSKQDPDQSNTVFINECDKRTNSKERYKERNRSNVKLKKFK